MKIIKYLKSCIVFVLVNTSYALCWAAYKLDPDQFDEAWDK